MLIQAWGKKIPLTAFSIDFANLQHKINVIQQKTPK